MDKFGINLEHVMQTRHGLNDLRRVSMALSIEVMANDKAHAGMLASKALEFVMIDSGEWMYNNIESLYKDFLTEI